MKINETAFCSDNDGDDSPENIPGLETVDHRHDLCKVFEQIDGQLKEFGLEIESYDTGSDFYAWRIIRRQA